MDSAPEDRDRSIADRYRAGESVRSLARTHRISHARVYQILERELTEEERAAVPRDRRAPVRHDPDEIYKFILDYMVGSCGRSPTHREIMASCNISSLSVVENILVRLEAAGKIERHGRNRSFNIAIPGARWVPPKQ